MKVYTISMFALKQSLIIFLKHINLLCVMILFSVTTKEIFNLHE